MSFSVANYNEASNAGRDPLDSSDEESDSTRYTSTSAELHSMCCDELLDAMEKRYFRGGFSLAGLRRAAWICPLRLNLGGAPVAVFPIDEAPVVLLARVYSAKAAEKKLDFDFKRDECLYQAVRRLAGRGIEYSYDAKSKLRGKGCSEVLAWGNTEGCIVFVFASVEDNSTAELMHFYWSRIWRSLHRQRRAAILLRKGPINREVGSDPHSGKPWSIGIL